MWRSPVKAAGVGAVAVVVVVVAVAAAVAVAVPAWAAFSLTSSAAQSVSTGTLAPPTGLSSANGLCAQGKSTSVELTWTPTVSEFATGYAVWRADGLGKRFDMVGTAGGRAAAGYTDTTVKFGTLYFYEVRALRNNWSSAGTEQVAITTLGKACK